ncbi:MAG: TatD family hydrolase [Kofleriaceae bacterium]
MIDSHCHLDGDRFDGDRPVVVARAVAAGVRGLLVPAIRPATWAALTALPSTLPGAPLALALGVHPQVVPALDAAERALADTLTEALGQALTERGGGGRRGAASTGARPIGRPRSAGSGPSCGRPASWACRWCSTWSGPTTWRPGSCARSEWPTSAA